MFELILSLCPRVSGLDDTTRPFYCRISIFTVRIFGGLRAHVKFLVLYWLCQPIFQGAGGGSQSGEEESFGAQGEVRDHRFMTGHGH